MGNPLAFIVIALWPFVALVFYARMGAAWATIWTVLGAYLLLPPVTAIQFPLLPDLDKGGAAALGGLLGLALVSRDGRLALPRSPLVRWMMLLYVIAPLLSAADNRDILITGPGMIAGMTAYDGISFALGNAATLIPMVLAASVLGSERGAQRLLRAFTVAGLAYALPILMEIRLSPQLNVWIYGFFAHDFLQMIRYGGYRPMVFLTHGLWVALFAFMAAASAAHVARLRGFAMQPVLVLGFLLVIVVLCKSMGAILYTVAIVPLILLATPRQQILVAVTLGLLVATYPLLRYFGLFPADALVDLVLAIDAERASSLSFRFANETALLEHATERTLLGWSGWGRHMVFDPVTGAATSVSDGRWIIALGIGGLFGYAIEFGLLLLPIFAAMLRARICPPAIAALTLIHATTLVDLLPNATLTPLSWLITGLLLVAIDNLRTAEVPATRPMALSATAGPPLLLGAPARLDRAVRVDRAGNPLPGPQAAPPGVAARQPMLGAGSGDLHLRGARGGPSAGR